MKNLMMIMIISLVTVTTNNLFAQKQTETIIIKTSTECGMCKARLEKAMAYEKGIKSSSLDVEKAELTVIYKPTKTSPEKIRKAISEVGYDADDIKANQKAHDNLPACCQKGGMNH